MKYSPKRGSTLFLIELIIVIFFFAIGAACCTQMFVKAWMTSREARNLNEAKNLAESMAAVIEAVDRPEEEISEYFPHIITKENRYLVYYDEDWQECDEKKASYCMEVELSVKDQTKSGDITIRDQNEKQIYQLEIYSHIPQLSGQKNE